LEAQGIVFSSVSFQADRQADRQTDRHRQADRQTDRQTPVNEISFSELQERSEEELDMQLQPRLTAVIVHPPD